MAREDNHSLKQFLLNTNRFEKSDRIWVDWYYTPMNDPHIIQIKVRMAYSKSPAVKMVNVQKHIYLKWREMAVRTIKIKNIKNKI